LTTKSGLHGKEGGITNSDTEIQADENNHDNSVGEIDQIQSEHASLVTLNDADDEFYDVPEPSDYDESENGWIAECSHQKSQVKDDIWNICFHCTEMKWTIWSFKVVCVLKLIFRYCS